MSTRNTQQDERIQKVVLMRHGVARHNLYDPITRRPPNLNDPMLLDPPLVIEGKKQVLDAGERLSLWCRTINLGEQVELVIASPLTRCLQTATLAFTRGDCYTENREEPMFYCTELIREAYGMHFPDQRRPKSLLEV